MLCHHTHTVADAAPSHARIDLPAVPSSHPGQVEPPPTRSAQEQSATQTEKPPPPSRTFGSSNPDTQTDNPRTQNPL